MDLKRCRFDGKEKLHLDELPTGCSGFDHDSSEKADFLDKTKKNLARIAQLQEQLYAEGKQGVIIVLQAMDAAGKDSTVKHVMSTVNPQGVDVYSFKQPTSTELGHDYLWRAVTALPTRGKMAIFNRSYYEDVLVVKVHQLQKGYKMAKRCVEDKDFFKKRYRQISNFEEYLYDNSYRVIKIFLNVSKDTQKKRFMERLDDPSKNWKFSAADLKEREFWNDYHAAYQDAINGTASEHSPWYIIPADQKWFARYLISQAVVDVLEECDPQYPEMPPEEKAHLADCKAQLGCKSDDEPQKSHKKKHKKHKKSKDAPDAARPEDEDDLDAPDEEDEDLALQADAEDITPPEPERPEPELHPTFK